MRYTGSETSKTISFISSSSCKTKVFQIFKAKRFLAEQNCQDINVTDDN